ncbi:GNAT family N-acetyltransferase [Nocardia salmonicida]|uniref:GNAT family N-acetyltransferase n=1 Tax=Nocardia salmonicida TaxID=53431 RepID=UPI0037A2B928
MPEIMAVVVDSERFSATTQPTIHGPGDLALRPWTENDASVVFTAYRDPAISRWHSRTAESVDQVHQWIKTWTATWSTGNGQWAVTSGDMVVGRIGLRHSDLVEGVTESPTGPCQHGVDMASHPEPHIC